MKNYRSEIRSQDIDWNYLCEDRNLAKRNCMRLKKLVEKHGVYILKHNGVTNVNKYIKGRSPSPTRKSPRHHSIFDMFR